MGRVDERIAIDLNGIESTRRRNVAKMKLEFWNELSRARKTKREGARVQWQYRTINLSFIFVQTLPNFAPFYSRV